MSKKNPLILYGVHAVRAALLNDRRVCRRLWLTGRSSDDIERLAAARSVPVERGSPQTLTRLVGTDSLHQGLGLEVEPLQSVRLEDGLRDWQTRSRATVVVLDQPSDARNLGAVLRSVACLGGDAVVCTERHAPGESGHLAKAASGAGEIVPLIRVTNLVRALGQLQDAGFWCAGFEGDAEQPLEDYDWPSHSVLVFGTEGRGLRPGSRKVCDSLLTIPLNPATRAVQLESLNLAQSVSIALYARSIKCTKLPET